MDYLSLLQRPVVALKYDQQTSSLKSMGAGPLDDFWYDNNPHSDDDTDPATLFRGVAWLYRGVQLRSNAVAAMPFRVMQGETEIDNSKDYQNAVGWLPNPRRLMYLTEAALTCYGSAYWWRERNRVRELSVHYIRPDTIEPIIDASGLRGFYRSANGRRIQVPVQQLAYFWQADPWVELGPPESSPLMAAISASGVLYNLNRFSAAYFKRGAIKATLLTVQGAPVAAERDRLKTWWKSVFSGVSNAWRADIINADAVTPIIIGEGLKELSSAELTAEKRQDIAQALGIPQSVMFSESASGLGGGGVALQDKLHFYEDTIIPECNLVEDVINEQMLTAAGYRLEFLPNTLDVFQEDENQRAAAFASYVGAGLPVDLVAEMLGLELPAGWTYDKLRQRREENEQRMQEQMEPQEVDYEDDEDDRDAKALADLRAWRRKSAKRGKLAEFVSDHIPPAVADDIKAHGSNGWRDALDGVIAVYAGEEPEQERTPSIAADTTELVAALRSATEALLGDYDEIKGGAGSGNWGHRGRPGKRGGSAPGGGLGGGGGGEGGGENSTEDGNANNAGVDTNNVADDGEWWNGPAIREDIAKRHYDAGKKAAESGQRLEDAIWDRFEDSGSWSSMASFELGYKGREFEVKEWTRYREIPVDNYGRVTPSFNRMDQQFENGVSAMFPGWENTVHGMFYVANARNRGFKKYRFYGVDTGSRGGDGEPLVIPVKRTS